MDSNVLNFIFASITTILCLRLFLRLKIVDIVNNDYSLLENKVFKKAVKSLRNTIFLQGFNFVLFFSIANSAISLINIYILISLGLFLIVGDMMMKYSQIVKISKSEEF